MLKQLLVLAFCSATLLGACDRKPEPSGRTSSHASKTDASNASNAPASTTQASGSTTPPLSATPTVSADTPITPSEEPEEVEKVKLPKPEGVEFVPREKWEAQEPKWDSLKKMTHAENVPILDIVVMHAVVLTTAENEQEKLKQIQFYHMDKARGRDYGDIAAHYLIGPSGAVYEGRDLRYRPEATAGSGMGRFGDPWGKCVIMLLGNYNLPAQIFTEEAKNALTALINDRRQAFEHKFEDELKIREAETRVLRNSDGPFHLDVVRVRKHPTLSPVLQSFLDSGMNTPVQDGGTPTTVTDGGSDAEAGSGETGSP